MNTNRLAPALFLVGSLYALGCAAPTSESSVEPSATSEGASATGALTLDASSDHAVSGRFTLDAASVSFVFSRESDVLHARITTTAGAPLVETTLRDDGSHSTRILGDRLVVDVGAGAPAYTGDRAAEQALHDMPEAACLGALEHALADAKVDPSLLPRTRAVQAPPASSGAAGSVAPTAFYGSPYAVFAPCGSWTSPGSQALCGSTFFGWTNFTELNCSGSYALVVFDGVAEVVPPASNGTCGATRHGGWYWGMNVPMYNASSTRIYFGH